MPLCVHCRTETLTHSTLIGAPVCNAVCASSHGARRGATAEMAFVGADSEVAALTRLWPALAQIGDARETDGGHLMVRRVAHTLASVVKPIGARRPGETDRQYAARLVKEARARQAERERQRQRQSADVAMADPSYTTLATTAPPPQALPGTLTAAATTTTPLATTEPAPQYYGKELPNDIISLLIPLLNSRTELLSLYEVTGENPRVEQALPPTYYPDHVPNDIISLLMSYLPRFHDLLKLWELSGYNPRVTAELIRRTSDPNREAAGPSHGATSEIMVMPMPRFIRFIAAFLDVYPPTTIQNQRRYRALADAIIDFPRHYRAHYESLGAEFWIEQHAKRVLLYQMLFQRNPSLYSEYLSEVVPTTLPPRQLSSNEYLAILVIAGRRAGVRPPARFPAYLRYIEGLILIYSFTVPFDDRSTMSKAFIPYAIEAVSIILEDYRDNVLSTFNRDSLALLAKAIRDGAVVGFSPRARENLRYILQQRGLDA